MTTSIRRRIAGTIAAALVLAACGGGGPDTVGVQSWVSAFCSALSEWQNSVQDSASQLTEGLDPATGPEAGKAALSGFIDGVIADTDDLIDATNDAGIPDVENGEEVSDALIAAFENARSALSETRGEIEDLPTDPAQFGSQADEIGTSIRSSLSDIGSDLGQKLDNLAPEELREAFDETSCA
ncbi:MAG: hypothetical protein ACRDJI_01280 [Actinomycetota bacterium]